MNLHQGKVPHASSGWHRIDAAEAAALLTTDLESGLAQADATARRERFGVNALEERGVRSPWHLIRDQLASTLVLVLVTAAAISFIAGSWKDPIAILAIVILNASLGFFQEYRAERAMAALRRLAVPRVKVKRDGAVVDVLSADLVPGDIVMLEAGNFVPADGRVVESASLRMIEAILTGESDAVEKRTDAIAGEGELGPGDRVNMVFMGTAVSYGRGRILVTETGMATELGRVAGLIQGVRSVKTPLQQRLDRLGRILAAAALVVVGLIFGMGTLTGEDLVLMFMVSVSMAVAVIPEGLPAVVAIALALGAQRMLKRRALVRRLPAVETLGSTTVICSDKTGTLTRNEMTVVEAWTPAGGPCRIEGVGYAPVGEFRRADGKAGAAPADVRRLLLDAALCSDATLRRHDGQWGITGDPTEGALVVAAEKAGVAVEETRRRHARRDAIPFESENQLMATSHAEPDGRQRVIVKGAPEVVLRRCADGPDGVDHAALHAEVDRMASAGMRVLALAERHLAPGHPELRLEDIEKGLRFLGLVGMIDPPRPEAIAAVRACQGAGITVKMITGDHKATAQAIGRQLGLANEVAAISGSSLDGLAPDRLREVAQSTAVFARVAPEHKLRLVQALQASGHVAAMTGDGVNDAPALKQADIGVAMGVTGSSVSKEAADVVLTDDNFATIVAAVEEGRRVYDNLIKSLAFVLPTNLGLALILIYAVLFFPFDPQTRLLLLPIEPVQILWINLVAAVALALPLAFEAKEADVMRRPPRDPKAPVLSGFVIWRTVVAALLMTAGAIGVFLWELGQYVEAGTAHGVALAEAQTMAVTTVIAFQIFYLLNSRSLRDSVLRIGLGSNPAVYLGIATVLLAQGAFVYLPAFQAVFGSSPLEWDDLLVAAVVGYLIVPVVAAEKWLLRRAAARRATPADPA